MKGLLVLILSFFSSNSRFVVTQEISDAKSDDLRLRHINSLFYSGRSGIDHANAANLYARSLSDHPPPTTDTRKPPPSDGKKATESGNGASGTTGSGGASTSDSSSGNSAGGSSGEGSGGNGGSGSGGGGGGGGGSGGSGEDGGDESSLLNHSRHHSAAKEFMGFVVAAAVVVGAGIATASLRGRKVETVPAHPLKGAVNKRIEIFSHLAQHQNVARPPRRYEEDVYVQGLDGGSAIV